MKRKLLMTVATGLWISGALNYGAAVPALREDQQEAVLRQLQRTGERWAAPMWARPNLKIDVQALHTLTAQEKAQIQRVNDPVLNDLLSLGGEIGVELYLETKELTAQKLYDFAMAVHEIESENHVLQIVALDALVQAFLEGHDAALVRLHEYAAFDAYAHKGLAQNLLGLIYGIGAKVPKNKVKAKEYFSAAKEGGLDQSVINLVLINEVSNEEEISLLQDQQENKYDREAAFLLYKIFQKPDYLEESARLEHPKAQFLTAEHVLNTNTPLARHLYEQSAQQGYAASLTKLALIYHTGNCVQADQNKVNEYNAQYAQQARLFNARNANGVNDLVLREANEYPAIREFPFTPWVLSTLRDYQPDVRELRNALPQLTSLLQPWLSLQKDILFANNLSARPSIFNSIRTLSSNSDDFNKIMDTLRSFSRLTSLNLHLSRIYINLDRARLLEERLKSLENLISFELHLIDSSIGIQQEKSIEEEIKSLIKSLFTGLESASQFNSLVFVFHNNLFYSTPMIKEELKSLKPLKLLASLVIKEKLKFLPQLKSLKLDFSATGGDTGIEVEGGRALNETFKTLTLLTSLTLDLFRNRIKATLGDGLESLINLTLLDLNLGENLIRNQGAEKISNALKKFKKLTSLKLILPGNEIGNLGSSALSEGINSLTELKELKLDLSFNYNVNKLIDGLISLLKERKRLESLYLRSYHGKYIIPDDTKKQLESLIEKNNKNFEILW